MVDVPPEVLYGQVIGRFVKFVADTTDAGTVPDELPLDGTVTLTPLTTVLRWPTTNPPRLAVPDIVTCPVTAGDLLAPGSLPVYVIASEQPEAEPTLCQWRATFSFNGIKTQPASVVFEVPAGGVVDISQAIPLPPEPPAITVVSTETAEAAELSAQAAEQAATQAAASAQAAHDWAVSGNPGAPGTPATVSVGTTTTLAPGSPATVTDSDPAASNAVLNFGIPQGATGAKGDKGDQGPMGAPGVIVLSAAAPIPGGTPAGTIVLRTAT